MNMRVKQLDELNRVTPEAYRKQKKMPLIVVLDNIRSLNNVGAIFRSSDAFCIQAIYLCGITATPPHADIHKTALGAEDTVEWRYFEKTMDAVFVLREQNAKICVLELTTQSIQLTDFSFDSNNKTYAVIAGNEVKGVQQEIVDVSDCAIEIPQDGVKHSLNVSVATSIVLWEFYRQWKADNR